MSDRLIQVERDGEKITLALPPHHFTIDPTALDSDLCTIGGHMLEYGTVEAELKSEVARKEAELDVLYAQLDGELRAKSKKSDERLTETRIKNLIVGTGSYQFKVDDVRNSQRNANIMRWAMTSLNKKCDCLLEISRRERVISRTEG